MLLPSLIFLPLWFFPHVFIFFLLLGNMVPSDSHELHWGSLKFSSMIIFSRSFFLKLVYPFLLLPHRTFQFPLIIGLLTIVVQVSNNKMNPLLYKQSIFYFYFYTGNSIWTRNFSSTVPFQDYIFTCAFKPEKLLSSILFLILIHFFFKKKAILFEGNFFWRSLPYNFRVAYFYRIGQQI